MIDIKLLRENPDLFYNSVRARSFDTAHLDRFFELDKEWRENLRKINDLKHEKNVITASISEAIKNGTDSDQLKNDVKRINLEIENLDSGQKAIETGRESELKLIPNLIHESVPICSGDENSVVVKTWGLASVHPDDLDYFRSNTNNMGQYKLSDFKPESHVDLIQELGLADLERAGKTSGARFFYLKNRLVKLELALMNYAVDFLSERGFSIIEPPFMLNHKSMDGATDLETFKDTLYKIEGEDLYLIATSEHSLAAMFGDEVFDEKELPVRVAGISPCFRREAGAHGKDTKGIFRVHQFTKVEQFVFCHPDQSWEFLDEILSNAEQIFRNLKIPYRVVNICSADLGSLAAKKFDIEAWFPAQGKFREVVSASNDTDYQARSLGIKFRSKYGNRFLHTLNSTAIASTRTMVAIMENFQRKDEKGFEIPEVLIPYTGFDFVSQDHP